MDEKFKKLEDIPIPSGYMWIWRHFLNIWQGCKRDVMGNIEFTFETVNSYVKCMKVPLSIRDKQLLFRMKAWAFNGINEVTEKS